MFVDPLQVKHVASQLEHVPPLLNLLLGQEALHSETSRTLPDTHVRQLLFAPPLHVAHVASHTLHVEPSSHLPATQD